MSQNYDYNVTFMEQIEYHLSENKSGLHSYPDVIPQTMEEFQNMTKDKYNTTFNSISVPPGIYVFLITLGLSCNLINIAVLTRPSMLSPLNFLLTGLELVNIAIFIGFIPELFAAAFVSDRDRVGYNWNLIFIITRAMSTACMFMSNWFAVTIGLFRFIAVTWPFSAGKCCSSTNAKLSVLVIGLVSIVVASIFYCLNVVSPYVVAVYQDAYSEAPLFFQTFCVTQPIIPFEDESSRYRLESVLLLLSTSIPCLVSALLTLLLICNLCIAKKRRRRLSENRNANSIITRDSKKEDAQVSGTIVKNKTTNVEARLTITLLVILVISNVSYLPTSILYIALLIDDQTILNSIVYNLSESGIGTILSNSLTFYVYIIMSQRFRKTTIDLVFGSFRKPATSLIKSRSNETNTSSSYM